MVAASNIYFTFIVVEQDVLEYRLSGLNKKKSTVVTN